MNITSLRPDTLDRMVQAVQDVRERVRRAAAALDAAGVAYCIAGGNAVGGWVVQRDRGKVRATSDVDILVRRADFADVKAALEGVGFLYHHLLGVDVFIDGPDGIPSEGVHLLYANEKVRPDYVVPNPDVTDFVPGPAGYRIVGLEGLVRMKLASYRIKDRMHLLDLTQVGFFDDTWPDRFPPPLDERLRAILADPDG